MPNINDYEMGDDDDSLNPYKTEADKPRINTPAQENKATYTTFKNPDPKAPGPTQVPAPAPSQVPAPAPSQVPAQVPSQVPSPLPTQTPSQYPAQTPTLSQTPTTQPPTNKATKVVKPIDLKARKRAIFGCFGAFFVVVILLLVFSFIFIANAENASENPIAKLLNVNPTTFVNGLITFIHIIFLITALGIFLITMSGLIKVLTAKKDDKDQKKAGIKISAISGVVLFVFLISWLFAFVYLDSKRIEEMGPVLKPIVTTPEVLLNLQAPILIKFDATNVPYDEKNWQIVSYSWDFGDKTTGLGVVTSKTFKEKGTFEIKLEVKRRHKETTEEQSDFYFELVSIAGSKLEAIVIAEPLSGEIPLTVKFDASRSVDLDNQILEYEWDLDGDLEFDDGKGEKVEFKYDKAGKYKASLRITNSIGDFATVEVEIEAKESEIPEAIIEINGNPQVFEKGRQYVFSADKSSSPNGKITNYSWDFGDGTPPVTTRTASHAYTNEGLFKLKLMVLDDKGKEGEAIKDIQIGSPKGVPKAEFQTDLLQGKAPLEITFDGSLTTDADNNIVQYEWDFESDGKVDAYNMRTKYTYKEPGTYTATLKVIDADDNTSTATQVIKVTEQGILVDLKADRIDGTVPLTVQFDASGSSYTKGQITSYRWDFGDKTTPKLGSAKINHKYDQVGTYTVAVEVIASDNTTAKKEMLITVREVALFSCFVSVFEEGPAPLTTAFDPACSTGTISKYFWDFGDGSTSSDLKPTHTFDRPGDYKVSLEVSDADNTVDRSEVEIKVSE